MDTGPPKSFKIKDIKFGKICILCTLPDSPYNVYCHT